MKEKINKILSEWNIIGVPEYIAEQEYTSYAEEIAHKYRSFGDIHCYIMDIFDDIIGINLTDSIRKEILEVTHKVYDIIKNNS